MLPEGTRWGVEIVEECAGLAEALHSAFESILERGGEGLIVVDAQGRIVGASPTAERLVEPMTLLRRPPHWPAEQGLFRSDGRALASEELPLARALAGEVLDELELLARSPRVPDGVALTVSARPLISRAGPQQGALLVLRELVQGDVPGSSNDLLRARELARAERERSSAAVLLDSMSHDLRTPLNAIIGFSELLEQEIFGALSARQKEYVSYVLHSGRRLLGLLSDLVDLAKLESGRVTLSPEWVAPQAIAESIQAGAQPLAKAQGVALEFDVQAGLPALYADALRLRQILLGLLAHTVKLTEPGGRVTLRVTRRGDKLSIEVEHTGVPSDTEAALGARGQGRCLDGDAEPKNQAPGLSYTLSERLVELHGGSMWARPSGSFSVLLPLRFANG